ncbi:MAG TPA: arsenate reductase family protein [Ruminococcus sp.]|nr:arsenate reductase family protein [Ruminococcus sp.]
MNIQIFGSKKSNDSKKAERYFKERGIKLQFIDMKEKGMSRGEFDNVARALGGFKELIDENAKDKQTLTLMKYLSDSDAEEKLFENQQLIKLPIVRNGKQATLGYQPDIWKTWE